MAGATQYDVQASTSPTFNTVIDSGWITGTSYTFNNLTLETTYYFRVRAPQFQRPGQHVEPVHRERFQRGHV